MNMKKLQKNLKTYAVYLNYKHIFIYHTEKGLL